MSTGRYSPHLLLLFLGLSLLACQPTAKYQPGAPNILFVFADDWSYPHAGIYGDKVVQTPHFDRIAREGILFDQAYVSAPSCTPSRAAVLTGQHFWRLQEGANLYGPLRQEIPTYPDLLSQSGYHVGYTHKGWAPGEAVGRPHNPAGEGFDSFSDFLSHRQNSQPFCFWFGSFNPHRGYAPGSGAAAGISPAEIDLPVCFPESEEIRSDVADYYKEVQDFDTELGELLAQLEEMAELDNTLIVVSSDNGMPFPRCKSNLYDLGTRVPLAIRWGDEINPSFRTEDFVSLTDLAPTFLEAAGVSVPEVMTGHSLAAYWTEGKEPAEREAIFFGKERHVPGQEAGDWGGYPSRAVRTGDYLYIRNFRPDRWPAGTPAYDQATFFPAFYADVDGGPTRTYILAERDKDKTHAELFRLAFEKRPAEELYDLQSNPDQLHNVAGTPEYAAIQSALREQLTTELQATQDPRIQDQPEIFESYPYTGGAPFPDHFQRQGNRYATVRIDSFPSQFADPRPIEILVPVNVSWDQRFSVLYMFDGQNIFHEFEGWGGEPNRGWQVDEVLDSLNTNGTVPPIIVVGIFNGTNKRGAEYMPAQPRALLQQRIAASTDEWERSFVQQPPESDQQLRFVVEELKPYIDAHFKTIPDQAHTFVAGSSMGGLISAYAICEYPEVFGGAACFSTHWVMFDGVFLEYFKDHLPNPATHKLYFDHGTEGLDSRYEPYQRIADSALVARGYVKGQNWLTLKYQGAKHHEDDWHTRFHVPMEFLFATEK